MKYGRISLAVLLLITVLMSGLSALCVNCPPIKRSVFKNITVDQNETYAPSVVTFRGEIFNNYTNDIGIVNLTLKECGKTLFVKEYGQSPFPGLIIKPNESIYFTLNYTLHKSGTYNISLIFNGVEFCPDSIENPDPSLPPPPRCSYPIYDIYNVTIKVYAPNDTDADGWNDTIEQTIEKYYTEFDPVNETPSKDIIVMAVTNAVDLYFRTDDIEKREEIVNEVTILVDEYFKDHISPLC